MSNSLRGGGMDIFWNYTFTENVMKLIQGSQATLVHVQIKIVKLADCLLLGR